MVKVSSHEVTQEQGQQPTRQAKIVAPWFLQKSIEDIYKIGVSNRVYKSILRKIEGA